jgi:hypothetical protein
MNWKQVFSSIAPLVTCVAMMFSMGRAPAAEVANYASLVSGSHPSNAFVPEFRRCIRHWEETRVRRVELPDRSARNSGAVLLEIGSAGFPSYGYVRVDGTLMKSSFGPERDLGATPLGRHLISLYAGAAELPKQHTGGEMDDGECYFLTVFVRGKTSTAVAYGAVDSLGVDSLIKELVESASRP